MTCALSPNVSQNPSSTAELRTNGPGDYGAVNTVQDGFALTPLQRLGRAPEPATPLVFDDSVDMSTSPVEQVNRMHGAEFFTYAAELLRVHPPHMTDFSQVMRLRERCRTRCVLGVA